MREKFGRYEVQAEIGDGAMGRVFRAFDPLARRTVAVKTVKVELLAKESSEEYLRRFRREAQAAGGLSHPSIVTIYDVGEDFFVMEHLEGKSLQEVLTERGRLDLPSAVEILRPIADALDFAHSRGVIHRDIKPANIMVQSDGRPKLMDFGVAHIEATVMTATGQFLGSPSYMAPEQIGGAELTNRSDLFSLATVAYEILTGHRAFEGKTITTTIYKVMNSVPESPRSLNGELPLHCDDVFARALSKDPVLRFESARAFVAALDLKQLDESLIGAFDALTADTPAAEAPKLEASGPAGGPTMAPPPKLSDAQATMEIKGARAAIEKEAASAAKGEAPPAAPPPAKRALPAGVVGLAAALLVAAAVGAWWLRSRPAEDSPVSPAVVTTAPTPEAPVATPSPDVVASTLASPSAPEPSPSATAAASPKVPASAAPAPAKPARAAKAPKEPEATPTPAPVREGDLVELTPEVTPPKRLRGPSVELPEAARRGRLKGTVAVRMLVTEKGEPIDSEVVESAGDVLDQAVLRAIRRWRFEPATKDGVKVRVYHTVRFTFRSE